jgi:exonuclease III
MFVMIIMSLNIRGVGKASTKLALGKLMDLQQLDIIMLQETMGEGIDIMEDLSKLWKD